MLKEAKRLHDLGFAIHWLKPKSKMPVDAKWTTGPRKSFADLKAQYRNGMNLGVRIGASKLEKGYLAVVDVDVKSKDPAHQKEAYAKLSSLFPGLAWRDSARVATGRGNGSVHVYLRTPSRVDGFRAAQSSATVKCLMPSAGTPSANDLKRLSGTDLAKGYRLRPAWEISVMGGLQQLVLPPSIHPDTGRPYVWTKPINVFSDLKLCRIESKSKPVTKTTLEDFQAVNVDLEKRKLKPEIIALIREGEDCEDRSAALLSAATAMLAKGFTEVEVLSVLTDRENFLGSVGFEHAQTESRKRAAQWVQRYTLQKAKATASPDFEAISGDYQNLQLSPEKVAEQTAALVEPRSWKDDLDKTNPEAGGRVKNTFQNIVAILKGETGKTVFRRNEFSGTEIYGVNTPWGGRKGAEVGDIDLIRVKAWLADGWGFEAANDKINDAVRKIADESKFHPVRDYLDRLEWDGTNRVDTWLKRYLGAEAEEPYLSAVSRKTLVAMIARVYEPGRKFDHVLILEGNQGVGKSTAIKNLTGAEWFSDAQINIRDKDAVLAMSGVWVLELGELASLKKADSDQLKDFISRTTDRIRLPYGRRPENFPRQCIFIGSTNPGEYLRDTTGNRRFWPVKVGDCDFEGVARDRDQLLAEAKFLYDLDEPLYLEGKEMHDGARHEQEKREVHDTWGEILADFLVKEAAKPVNERVIDPERFTSHDLLSDRGPYGGGKDGPYEQKRLGEILRKMGFDNKTGWDRVTKVRKRYWFRVTAT